MHTASTLPLAHRDVKVHIYTSRGGSDALLANIYAPQPANLLLTDSRDELVLMDLGSAAPASVTVSNRSAASSASHHSVMYLLQAGSTGIAGGLCPDLHCSVQVSLSVHFVLFSLDLVPAELQSCLRFHPQLPSLPALMCGLSDAASMPLHLDTAHSMVLPLLP